MEQVNLATFGGGCFWCIEAIFSKIKGVLVAESGYSGGQTENPSYEEVCSGRTGHAEVVQIKFNPNIIDFDQLLLIFFNIHDPTTLNRQVYDVGTQYRSAIFFHSEEQKAKSEDFINNLTEKKAFQNIVTDLSEFIKFFKAEEYHQSYYDKNPENAYCRYNIIPKMEKFQRVFKDFLNE